MDNNEGAPRSRKRGRPPKVFALTVESNIGEIPASLPGELEFVMPVVAQLINELHEHEPVEPPAVTTKSKLGS